MKNFLPILSLILSIVVTNCKPWHISQLSPPNTPITPKLPALQQSSQGILTVSSYQDGQELFSNEVEQNLTNPYGEKYGYIILITNTGNIKWGVGYTIISGATFFVTNLLGLPFSETKLEMEATIEILNSKKELIGRYRAVGKGKAVAALYYGYALTNTFRKAYADALKDAFSQIRPQIQADAERLSNELQKAGKISN